MKSHDELVEEYAQHARGLSRSYLPLAYTEQRAWVEDHGGNLSGYILRYGTAEEPLYGTLGGPAVYDADHAYLVALEREVLRRQGFKV